jgi:hypothetical protein
VGDGEKRRGTDIGWEQHLVPRANPEGEKGKVESGGPRGGGHAGRKGQEPPDLLLEGPYLAALGQISRGEDLAEGMLLRFIEGGEGVGDQASLTRKIMIFLPLIGKGFGSRRGHELTC